MFIEPYLANVTIFAGNFAPRGWMLCNGQLLAISQFDALFALLGTTYGGDGQTTFALPDLRSRIAVHPGQGPGLTQISLGEMSGSESGSMTTSQLPAHSHTLASLSGAQSASTSAGDQSDPTNHVPAVTTGINSYNTAGTGKMAPSTNNVSNIGIAGGSQPFDHLPPTLAMNYIIAVEGIFPSRN